MLHCQAYHYTYTVRAQCGIVLALMFPLYVCTQTLESRFAESLTSALATVPMLSELVLSCNMLRDQDMSTIGKLTRLQTLNLVMTAAQA